MVSEYQKKKRQAFSMFAAELGRMRGMPYPVAVQSAEIRDEWKKLTEAEQEVYKEAAKVYNAKLKDRYDNIAKDAAIAAAAPISDEEIRRRAAARAAKNDEWPAGGKRVLVDDDGVEEEPSSGASGASCGRTRKVIRLGDEEADIVEEEDEALMTQEFTAEHCTSKDELWMNAVDYYYSLQDIKECPVHFFHATPVVYASGYKHGSNPPVNRPVEIAVSTVSHKYGLHHKMFHAFIDPGKLLNSNEQFAAESRNDRHGVPHNDSLKDHDESCKYFFRHNFLDDRYYDVYRDLLVYLGYDLLNDPKGEGLPPLVCNEAMLKISECCYRWLYEKAREIAVVSSNLTVLPALKFMTVEDYGTLAIGNALKARTKPKVTYDKSRLEKDLCFDHNYRHSVPTICCDYHQKGVVCKECALGATREMAYKVLEIIGPYYRFPRNDERFACMPPEYKKAMQKTNPLFMADIPIRSSNDGVEMDAD